MKNYSSISQYVRLFSNIVLSSSLCICSQLPLAIARAEPHQTEDLHQGTLSSENLDGPYSLAFRNKLRPLILQKDQFLERSLIPQGAIPLSLQESQQAAFRNNPNLQKVILDLLATRDNLTAAQRSWNPTVSATSGRLPEYRYSSAYSGDNNIISSKSTKKTETQSNIQSADVQISAVWRFLDFSRQPNINSAQAAYYSQEYLYLAVSRTLLSDIESTYFSLLASDSLIRSYSSIVDSLIQNAYAIDARFSAGRVSLLDVGQIYARLFESLNQLVVYIDDYYASSSRLSALLSLPDNVLIIPTGANSFYGKWDLSLSESLDSAIKNNENIKQSLENANANRWGGISLLNSALPSLYIKTGGDWLSRNSNDISSAYAGGSYNTVTRSQWNTNTDFFAFLGFQWNLYQGGVNNAKASSQFNTALSFESQAKAQMDTLIEEVRTSYSSILSNQIRYESSSAAIMSARVAYDAAIARFGAGLTDVTTVNQAIDLYQSAIRSQAESVRQYNTSLSRLYKATAIWPPNTSQLADLEFIRRVSSPISIK